MKNTGKFDLNSIDLDADLNDILDLDFSIDDKFESMDIKKTNINHNTNNYSKNLSLLEEYSKTYNPIILQELLENNKALVLNCVNYYKNNLIKFHLQ